MVSSTLAASKVLDDLPSSPCQDNPNRRSQGSHRQLLASQERGHQVCNTRRHCSTHGHRKTGTQPTATIRIRPWLPNSRCHRCPPGSVCSGNQPRLRCALASCRAAGCTLFAPRGVRVVQHAPHTRPGVCVYPVPELRGVSKLFPISCTRALHANHRTRP